MELPVMVSLQADLPQIASPLRRYKLQCIQENEILLLASSLVKQMSKRVIKYAFLWLLSSLSRAMLVLYHFYYMSSLGTGIQSLSINAVISTDEDEMHVWHLMFLCQAFTKCSLWFHTLFFIVCISRLLSLLTQK